MNSKSLYSIWIQLIERDSEEKVKCNYLHQIQLPLSVFPPYVELSVSQPGRPHRNMQLDGRCKDKKRENIHFIDLSKHKGLYISTFSSLGNQGKIAKCQTYGRGKQATAQVVPMEEVSGDTQLTASSLDTYHMGGLRLYHDALWGLDFISGGNASSANSF